ncbi:MAG: UDP-N-acetylmuramoyl-L-alanine--D-glutamate ligase [Ruminiclostridium sp.]|nr:UDP-N-acetylmuramoyl-L-alanine--D-glutamate ligase [Ruminiclostridium sp.]
MNLFYERLRGFFDGKSVLILGFGREGRSTLRLLKEFGNCKITIADRNDVSCPETEGIEVISGEHYLDRAGEFGIIMKAPGIALFDDVSADIKARITSQTDLLLRFCPNRVIGVTGTKGKSTTASLIHHFLREYESSVLVGNIGIPPLECVGGLNDRRTIIVCEMSCHQLEYVQASPWTAVYLNLFEEHLDHYTGFDAYRKAKENIYRFQRWADYLVVNKELAPENCAASVITASLTEDADISVSDGSLRIQGRRYDNISTSLLGTHNLYNIGIAAYVAHYIAFAGQTIDDVLGYAETFRPLSHRLEKVGTVNGAEYINDSISTCPSTAIAAVRAFDKVDTIIIGGMDRGIDYTELIDFLNGSDIENVILLPDSGHKIMPLLDGSKRTLYKASDLADAVAFAKKVTKVRCVLSPAAASYGFYKNFEERGEHFRKLVNNE